MENTYYVYGLDENGTLFSLTANGKWIVTNQPTRFLTLAHARKVQFVAGVPWRCVDCYIWSIESECSFVRHLGELCLVPEAMLLVNEGRINYENAEILHRLPFAEWQRQFLGEAQHCKPAEFADIVNSVVRKAQKNLS